jgi:Flp pilus assembly protein TadD
LESIEAARAALRANPALPQAYRGLRFALLVGGHCSEALEAFREVQRLDPSDVSAELGTGASLTALGEHQAASAAFARALSREPDALEDYPEIEPFIAENTRRLGGRS